MLEIDNQIFLGDNKEVMRQFPDNYFDTIITDPPAAIGFMSKAWDGDKGGRDNWIAWLADIFKECLRVLKPGGLALVWSIPRTSHWTGMALEDGGFEIKDCLYHVFAQGFPKSQDLSIMIDQRYFRKWINENRPQAKRFWKRLFDCTESDIWAWKWIQIIRSRYGDIVGKRELMGIKNHSTKDFKDNLYAQDPANANNTKVFGYGQEQITVPSTPEAKLWDGHKTVALKPAAENWWLAMKPLEGNYVDNILKWGIGGLNIDAGRIATDDKLDGGGYTTPCSEGWDRPYRHDTNRVADLHAKKEKNVAKAEQLGRYPANVMLGCNCEEEHKPDCPVRILDEQSGIRQSGNNCKRTKEGYFGEHGGLGNAGDMQITYGDKGGASRFFFCSKPSKSEKDMGLEDMPEKQMYKQDNSPNSLEIFGTTDGGRMPRRNIHPTVKSLALLEYFCKLTRPPHGGIVLDPFMGSGTTCIAAINTGRKYCGIELEPEYFEIAQKRIAYARVNKVKEDRQIGLF